jgi:hypothetical protein
MIGLPLKPKKCGIVEEYDQIPDEKIFLIQSHYAIHIVI